jgi:hypothetical protein
LRPVGATPGRMQSMTRSDVGPSQRVDGGLYTHSGCCPDSEDYRARRGRRRRRDDRCASRYSRLILSSA